MPAGVLGAGVLTDATLRAGDPARVGFAGVLLGMGTRAESSFWVCVHVSSGMKFGSWASGN